MVKTHTHKMQEQISLSFNSPKFTVMTSFVREVSWPTNRQIKPDEFLGIQIPASVLFMSTSVSCYRGLLLDPRIYICVLEPNTRLHIVLKHSNVIWVHRFLLILGGPAELCWAGLT